ncbi:potassium channel family protein [Phaeodactylibacter xiamenensis]|uniref:potassium channel family protein n=1 Tax=Phaeodactylibacter xiamenensis TaxID=1524460 RepID=UPI0024A88217|nr:TrkA family potassium uptake protein [Phaeodactylibacter xiamenensis]
MKYIIIGLGNFGASLAQKLTRTGNEVIGVDSQMAKVELFKEKISHTICLDATDEQAVTHLPLRDTDVVMVCIGEDEGANILATALMKQKKAKRLISRAVSPLHETVLQAMHVDEIIHPEEETAERWAKKLNMHGVLDSYELTGDYCIVEAKVPERYDGKTLEQAGLNKKYGVIVLTLIAIQEEDNELGLKVPTPKTKGVANAQTELTADDIMVLYGKSEDIRKLLE